MARALIWLSLAWLLPLLLLAPPTAAQDVMALVRADRWADADAAVSQAADPVSRKLVTYYRLLAPNAASVAEIASFIAANPDWPQQAGLAKRREEALASEPDDAVVAAQCDAARPALAAALERCADAFARAGRAGDAAAAARDAWIATPSDAGAETRFLARWAGMLRLEDEARRFDHLAWTDTTAATRQLPRLALADRPAAEARLALRTDNPAAPALVAALPDAARSDPVLMLEQARQLRRANQDAAALALWTASGAAAERAAPAERRAAFWDERNILARRRLRDGDAAGAYALAAGHAQTQAEQIADAEFLAGFIALRRLGDVAGATAHFRTLGRGSRAVITQARSHYWLGRAAIARGDTTGARAEFTAAAAWPNTFYGQLAARAAGAGDAELAHDIVAARDPAFDPPQAQDFVAGELARAAAHLVAWGEPRRANAFLLRLAERAQDDTDRALAARFAAGLNLPESAIAIARRAGRDGVVLLQSGWPVAAEIPADAGVEPALALGIIRQESSFDSATVSPVGARGLMQLMPATAKQLAQLLSTSISNTALTADPAINIRLGTAYLKGLLNDFDGAVPLAVAAYNAGPNRVREWLAANGDPRQPQADIIDWIELIPFGETRNYVQRVIENDVVYRARTGDIRPHPLARWLG